MTVRRIPLALAHSESGVTAHCLATPLSKVCGVRNTGASVGKREQGGEGEEKCVTCGEARFRTHNTHLGGVGLRPRQSLTFGLSIALLRFQRLYPLPERGTNRES